MHNSNPHANVRAHGTDATHDSRTAAIGAKKLLILPDSVEYAGSLRRAPFDTEHVHLYSAIVSVAR
jgi:hypothetical protein